MRIELVQRDVHEGHGQTNSGKREARQGKSECREREGSQNGTRIYERKGMVSRREREIYQGCYVCRQYIIKFCLFLYYFSLNLPLVLGKI